MDKLRLQELAGMPLNEAADPTTAKYQAAVEALAQYVAIENVNNYKELSDEEKQKTAIDKYGSTGDTVMEYAKHMVDDVSDRVKAIMSKEK